MAFLALCLFVCLLNKNLLHFKTFLIHSTPLAHSVCSSPYLPALIIRLSIVYLSLYYFHDKDILI